MSRLDNIRQERLDKRLALIKHGVIPYPVRADRTHEIASVLGEFDVLESGGDVVSIAGRITSVREHGALTFLDIEDQSGSIQVVVKSDEYDGNFADTGVDGGDFAQVNGVAFKTKTGQQSIKAQSVLLLSKAIRPIPSDWHGFKDKEERLRKRYVDLLANENVREAFKKRSRMIAAIREFYHKHDFMEVETPILQVMPGGALAKPFKTKLNALDMDMYLRIAPELYLKRLLVGGFERVFELGRVFRNEGMDADHSPEFTMMEAYWAYQDHEGLMNFIEELMRYVVREVTGGESITVDGSDTRFDIDFGKPFERLDFVELVNEKAGIEYDSASREDLLAKTEELGIEVRTYLSKAKLADEIYKKVCRPFIAGPAFVVNIPREISPLAKRLEDNPDKVGRFLLLIGGNEAANGFAELNDPVDQLERFEQQHEEAQKGDEETHPIDHDYVEALEYGMPPAAGVGIGIDRLAMILTGVESLREIILFPPMRPRE